MPPEPTVRAARLKFAAALVLAEAALPLAYAGYLVVESIAQPTEAPAIGWATAVFLVGCAALVARVGRGLSRATSWSRAPAILVQLLLLAVGIPFVQGGQYLAGVPIVAAAVAELGLLFAAP